MADEWEWGPLGGPHTGTESSPLDLAADIIPTVLFGLLMLIAGARLYAHWPTALAPSVLCGRRCCPARDDGGDLLPPQLIGSITAKFWFHLFLFVFAVGRVSRYVLMAAPDPVTDASDPTHHNRVLRLPIYIVTCVSSCSYITLLLFLEMHWRNILNPAPASGRQCFTWPLFIILNMGLYAVVVASTYLQYVQSLAAQWTSVFVDAILVCIAVSYTVLAILLYTRISRSLLQSPASGGSGRKGAAAAAGSKKALAASGTTGALIVRGAAAAAAAPGGGGHTTGASISGLSMVPFSPDDASAHASGMSVPLLADDYGTLAPLRGAPAGASGTATGSADAAGYYQQQQMAGTSTSTAVVAAAAAAVAPVSTLAPASAAAAWRPSSPATAAASNGNPAKPSTAAATAAAASSAVVVPPKKAASGGTGKSKSGKNGSKGSGGGSGGGKHGAHGLSRALTTILNEEEQALVSAAFSSRASLLLGAAGDASSRARLTDALRVFITIMLSSAGLLVVRAVVSYFVLGTNDTTGNGVDPATQQGDDEDAGPWWYGLILTWLPDVPPCLGYLLLMWPRDEAEGEDAAAASAANAASASSSFSASSSAAAAGDADGGGASLSSAGYTGVTAASAAKRSVHGLFFEHCLDVDGSGLVERVACPPTAVSAAAIVAAAAPLSGSLPALPGLTTAAAAADVLRLLDWPPLRPPPQQQPQHAAAAAFAGGSPLGPLALGARATSSGTDQDGDASGSSATGKGAAAAVCAVANAVAATLASLPAADDDVDVFTRTAKYAAAAAAADALVASALVALEAGHIGSGGGGGSATAAAAAAAGELPVASGGSFTDTFAGGGGAVTGTGDPDGASGGVAGGWRAALLHEVMREGEEAQPHSALASEPPPPLSAAAAAAADSTVPAHADAVGVIGGLSAAASPFPATGTSSTATPSPTAMDTGAAGDAPWRSASDSFVAPPVDAASAFDARVAAYAASDAIASAMLLPPCVVASADAAAAADTSGASRPADGRLRWRRCGCASAAHAAGSQQQLRGRSLGAPGTGNSASGGPPLSRSASLSIRIPAAAGGGSAAPSAAAAVAAVGGVATPLLGSRGAAASGVASFTASSAAVVTRSLPAATALAQRFLSDAALVASGGGGGGSSSSSSLGASAGRDLLASGSSPAQSQSSRNASAGYAPGGGGGGLALATAPSLELSGLRPQASSTSLSLANATSAAAAGAGGPITAASVASGGHAFGAHLSASASSAPLSSSSLAVTPAAAAAAAAELAAAAAAHAAETAPGTLLPLDASGPGSSFSSSAADIIADESVPASVRARFSIAGDAAASILSDAAHASTAAAQATSHAAVSAALAAAAVAAEAAVAAAGAFDIATDYAAPLPPPLARARTTTVGGASVVGGGGGAASAAAAAAAPLLSSTAATPPTLPPAVLAAIAASDPDLLLGGRAATGTSGGHHGYTVPVDASQSTPLHPNLFTTARVSLLSIAVSGVRLPPKHVITAHKLAAAAAAAGALKQQQQKAGGGSGTVEGGGGKRPRYALPRPDDATDAVAAVAHPPVSDVLSMMLEEFTSPRAAGPPASGLASGGSPSAGPLGSFDRTPLFGSSTRAAAAAAAAAAGLSGFGLGSSAAAASSSVSSPSLAGAGGSGSGSSSSRALSLHAPPTRTGSRGDVLTAGGSGAGGTPTRAGGTGSRSLARHPSASGSSSSSLPTSPTGLDAYRAIKRQQSLLLAAAAAAAASSGSAGSGVSGGVVSSSPAGGGHDALAAPLRPRRQTAAATTTTTLLAFNARGPAGHAAAAAAGAPSSSLAAITGTGMVGTGMHASASTPSLALPVPHSRLGHARHSLHAHSGGSGGGGNSGAGVASGSSLTTPPHSFSHSHGAAASSSLQAHYHQQHGLHGSASAGGLSSALASDHHHHHHADGGRGAASGTPDASAAGNSASGGLAGSTWRRHRRPGASSGNRTHASQTAGATVEAAAAAAALDVRRRAAAEEAATRKGGASLLEREASRAVASVTSGGHHLHPGSLTHQRSGTGMFAIGTPPLSTSMASASGMGGVGGVGGGLFGGRIGRLSQAPLSGSSLYRAPLDASGGTASGGRPTFVGGIGAALTPAGYDDGTPASAGGGLGLYAALPGGDDNDGPGDGLLQRSRSRSDVGLAGALRFGVPAAPPGSSGSGRGALLFRSQPPPPPRRGRLSRDEEEEEEEDDDDGDSTGTESSSSSSSTGSSPSEEEEDEEEAAATGRARAPTSGAGAAASSSSSAAGVGGVSGASPSKRRSSTKGLPTRAAAADDDEDDDEDDDDDDEDLLPGKASTAVIVTTPALAGAAGAASAGPTGTDGGTGNGGMGRKRRSTANFASAAPAALGKQPSRKSLPGAVAAAPAAAGAAGGGRSASATAATATARRTGSGGHQHPQRTPSFSGGNLASANGGGHHADMSWAKTKRASSFHYPAPPSPAALFGDDTPLADSAAAHEHHHHQQQHHWHGGAAAALAAHRGAQRADSVVSVPDEPVTATGTGKQLATDMMRAASAAAATAYDIEEMLSWECYAVVLVGVQEPPLDDRALLAAAVASGSGSGGHDVGAGAADGSPYGLGGGGGGGGGFTPFLGAQPPAPAAGGGGEGSDAWRKGVAADALRLGTRSKSFDALATVEVVAASADAGGLPAGSPTTTGASDAASGDASVAGGNTGDDAQDDGDETASSGARTAAAESKPGTRGVGKSMDASAWCVNPLAAALSFRYVGHTEPSSLERLAAGPDTMPMLLPPPGAQPLLSAHGSSDSSAAAEAAAASAQHLTAQGGGAAGSRPTLLSGTGGRRSQSFSHHHHHHSLGAGSAAAVAAAAAADRGVSSRRSSGDLLDTITGAGGGSGSGSSSSSSSSGAAFMGAAASDSDGRGLLQAELDDAEEAAAAAAAGSDPGDAADAEAAAAAAAATAAAEAAAAAFNTVPTGTDFGLSVPLPHAALHRAAKDALVAAGMSALQAVAVVSHLLYRGPSPLAAASAAAARGASRKDAAVAAAIAAAGSVDGWSVEMPQYLAASLGLAPVVLPQATAPATSGDAAAAAASTAGGAGGGDARWRAALTRFAVEALNRAVVRVQLRWYDRDDEQAVMQVGRTVRTGAQPAFLMPNGAVLSSSAVAQYTAATTTAATTAAGGASAASAAGTPAVAPPVDADILAAMGASTGNNGTGASPSKHHDDAAAAATGKEKEAAADAAAAVREQVEEADYIIASWDAPVALMLACPSATTIHLRASNLVPVAVETLAAAEVEEEFGDHHQQNADGDDDEEEAAEREEAAAAARASGRGPQPTTSVASLDLAGYTGITTGSFLMGAGGTPAAHRSQRGTGGGGGVIRRGSSAASGSSGDPWLGGLTAANATPAPAGTGAEPADPRRPVSIRAPGNAPAAAVSRRRVASGSGPGVHVDAGSATPAGGSDILGPLHGDHDDDHRGLQRHASAAAPHHHLHHHQQHHQQHHHDHDPLGGVLSLSVDRVVEIRPGAELLPVSCADLIADSAADAALLRRWVVAVNTMTTTTTTATTAAAGADSGSSAADDFAVGDASSSSLAALHGAIADRALAEQATVAAAAPATTTATGNPTDSRKLDWCAYGYTLGIAMGATMAVWEEEAEQQHQPQPVADGTGKKDAVTAAAATAAAAAAAPVPAVPCNTLAPLPPVFRRTIDVKLPVSMRVSAFEATAESAYAALVPRIVVPMILARRRQQLRVVEGALRQYVHLLQSFVQAPHKPLLPRAVLVPRALALARHMAAARPPLPDHVAISRGMMMMTSAGRHQQHYGGSLPVGIPRSGAREYATGGDDAFGSGHSYHHQQQQQQQSSSLLRTLPSFMGRPQGAGAASSLTGAGADLHHHQHQRSVGGKPSSSGRTSFFGNLMGGRSPPAAFSGSGGGGGSFVAVSGGGRAVARGSLAPGAATSASASGGMGLLDTPTASASGAGAVPLLQEDHLASVSGDGTDAASINGGAGYDDAAGGSGLAVGGAVSPLAVGASASTRRVVSSSSPRFTGAALLPGGGRSGASGGVYGAPPLALAATARAYSAPDHYVAVPYVEPTTPYHAGTVGTPAAGQAHAGVDIGAAAAPASSDRTPLLRAASFRPSPAVLRTLRNVANAEQSVLPGASASGGVTLTTGAAAGGAGNAQQQLGCFNSRMLFSIGRPSSGGGFASLYGSLVNHIEAEEEVRAAVKWLAGRVEDLSEYVEELEAVVREACGLVPAAAAGGGAAGSAGGSRTDLGLVSRHSSGGGSEPAPAAPGASAKTGPPYAQSFKSSRTRKETLTRFIPTNLHVQMLSLAACVGADDAVNVIADAVASGAESGTAAPAEPADDDTAAGSSTAGQPAAPASADASTPPGSALLSAVLQLLPSSAQSGAGAPAAPLSSASALVQPETQLLTADHSIVTIGAPAAHTFGFKSGGGICSGISKLLALTTAPQLSRSRRELSRNSILRDLEESKSRLRHRADTIVTQAIAGAVATFANLLGGALKAATTGSTASAIMQLTAALQDAVARVNAAGSSTAASTPQAAAAAQLIRASLQCARLAHMTTNSGVQSLRQWMRVGFPIMWESLLSTWAKERGMLEDLRFACSTLGLLRFALVDDASFDAATTDGDEETPAAFAGVRRSDATGRGGEACFAEPFVRESAGGAGASAVGSADVALPQCAVGSGISAMPLHVLRHLQKSGTLAVFLGAGSEAAAPSAAVGGAATPSTASSASLPTVTRAGAPMGAPAVASAAAAAELADVDGLVFLIPVRGLRAAMDAGLLPEELHVATTAAVAEHAATAGVAVAGSRTGDKLALPHLQLPLISVVPILLTQGINEMMAMARVMGSTELQETINKDAIRSLKVYTDALAVQAIAEKRAFDAVRARVKQDLSEALTDSLRTAAAAVGLRFDPPATPASGASAASDSSDAASGGTDAQPPAGVLLPRLQDLLALPHLVQPTACWPWQAATAATHDAGAAALAHPHHLPGHHRGTLPLGIRHWADFCDRLKKKNKAADAAAAANAAAGTAAAMAAAGGAGDGPMSPKTVFTTAGDFPGTPSAAAAAAGGSREAKRAKQHKSGVASSSASVVSTGGGSVSRGGAAGRNARLGAPAPVTAHHHHHHHHHHGRHAREEEDCAGQSHRHICSLVDWLLAPPVLTVTADNHARLTFNGVRAAVTTAASGGHHSHAHSHAHAGALAPSHAAVIVQPGSSADGVLAPSAHSAAQMPEPFGWQRLPELAAALLSEASLAGSSPSPVAVAMRASQHQGRFQRAPAPALLARHIRDSLPLELRSLLATHRRAAAATASAGAVAPARGNRDQPVLEALLGSVPLPPAGAAVSAASVATAAALRTVHGGLQAACGLLMPVDGGDEGIYRARLALTMLSALRWYITDESPKQQLQQLQQRHGDAASMSQGGRAGGGGGGSTGGSHHGHSVTLSERQLQNSILGGFDVHATHPAAGGGASGSTHGRSSSMVGLAHDSATGDVAITIKAPAAEGAAASDGGALASHGLTLLMDESSTSAGRGLGRPAPRWTPPASLHTHHNHHHQQHEGGSGDAPPATTTTSLRFASHGPRRESSSVGIGFRGTPATAAPAAHHHHPPSARGGAGHGTGTAAALPLDLPSEVFAASDIGWHKGALPTPATALDELPANYGTIEHDEDTEPAAILRLTEDIARVLGGGRMTSCKSSKDRTGMSVTLEQARLIAQFETAAASTLAATVQQLTGCMATLQRARHAPAGDLHAPAAPSARAVSQKQPGAGGAAPTAASDRPVSAPAAVFAAAGAAALQPVDSTTDLLRAALQLWLSRTVALVCGTADASEAAAGPTLVELIEMATAGAAGAAAGCHGSSSGGGALATAASSASRASVPHLRGAAVTLAACTLPWASDAVTCSLSHHWHDNYMQLAHLLHKHREAPATGASFFADMAMKWSPLRGERAHASMAAVLAFVHDDLMPALASCVRAATEEEDASVQERLQREASLRRLSRGASFDADVKALSTAAAVAPPAAAATTSQQALASAAPASLSLAFSSAVRTEFANNAGMEESVTGEVVEMANFMREWGSRLANAHKNTGQFAFAFNTIQRSFFAHELRCPVTVMGKAET